MFASLSFSLVKGLKRQGGVEDAKLFLDPAYMKVTLKAGAWVEPSRLMKAIRDPRTPAEHLVLRTDLVARASG